MDKRSEYSVDDILLEYELKQQKEKQQATAAPKSAAERFAETVTPAKASKSAATTFKKEDTAELPAVKPQAVRAARPAEPDTTELPAVKAASSEDEGDTVQLGPLRPVKKIKEPEKVVAVSTHTRVLTVEEPVSSGDTGELPSPDQLEGQMVMENFLPDTMDEQELREELHRRRQEKVDGFRIIEGGKQPFKLLGEEEGDGEDDVVEEDVDPENDEQEDDAEEAEDLLEDFNEYAEADAIRSELVYRRRMGAIGMIATAGMEAMLVLLTVLYQWGWLGFASPAVLTALHAALLVGMLCLNNTMIGAGLKSLFKGRADSDSPSAVCGVIGLVYTVAQFAALSDVAAGSALFLSAAAGLGVLAGAVGRQVQIMRISRNFSFVAGTKHTNYAAMFIDDEKTAMEIGKPADIDGIPPIVYYRKAPFLTRFLENSYSFDPADRVMRWFVPLSLGVSLLCAVGYGLLFPEHVWKAPTVFVSSVLATMPVWALFVSQRALGRSAKKALKSGAMIGGFAATERFGRRVKYAVVEAAELFPKDQVKLHGIKTFSGTRIDDAIIDAAAVEIAAGGPLSPIFHRLIENRTDILREVDSLAYEQDMGLSGWVGGRRVLIGNRRLLKNHGVDVPEKDYEARYCKDGRNIVYLSTGGELSAMFVVSYLAAPAIKEQVKALVREHITLLVRTCDPNVTASLVEEAMELPSLSVDVMSAAEGRAYGTLLRSQETERADAVLACGGRGISKMFAVVQCRRLRRGVWAGLVALAAAGIAMMAFAAFVSATTGLVLTPMALVGSMLAFGIIGWLIPKLLKA